VLYVNPPVYNLALNDTLLGMPRGMGEKQYLQNGTERDTESNELDNY